MSDRTPWWFSGDEQVDEHRSDGAETQDTTVSSAMDWMALVSGVKRVVDWATESVMAPHAEHEDPSAYPQCVVCRSLVVLGDVGLLSEAETTPPPADQPAPGSEAVSAIEWIPVRDGAASA